MNLIFKKQLPRRTFLRGMGGVAALPFLDAMIPALGRADAAKSPARMAVLYFPNGVQTDSWYLNATSDIMKTASIQVSDHLVINAAQAEHAGQHPGGLHHQGEGNIGEGATGNCRVENMASESAVYFLAEEHAKDYSDGGHPQRHGRRHTQGKQQTSDQHRLADLFLAAFLHHEFH